MTTEEEIETAETHDPAYAKPLPLLEGPAAAFYSWCRKHELRFQRCASCGTWRHVPRLLCPECASPAFEWERSSGRGRLFTWTVAARALHRAFQQDAPYAPVVVEMEEGVRMVSALIDCPPEELEIGMPVEVVFEDVTPDVTLPKFRRARRERQRS